MFKIRTMTKVLTVAHAIERSLLCCFHSALIFPKYIFRTCLYCRNDRITLREPKRIDFGCFLQKHPPPPHSPGEAPINVGTPPPSPPQLNQLICKMPVY